MRGNIYSTYLTYSRIDKLCNKGNWACWQLLAFGNRLWLWKCEFLVMKKFWNYIFTTVCEPWMCQRLVNCCATVYNACIQSCSMWWEDLLLAIFMFFFLLITCLKLVVITSYFWQGHFIPCKCNGQILYFCSIVGLLFYVNYCASKFIHKRLSNSIGYLLIGPVLACVLQVHAHRWLLPPVWVVWQLHFVGDSVLFSKSQCLSRTVRFFETTWRRKQYR